MFLLSENEFPSEDYNFLDLFDRTVNSTRLYMLVLYALIRSNNYKNLVELGAFRGNTTSVLARAAKMNGGRLSSYDLDPQAINWTRERLFSNGLRADLYEGLSSEPQHPGPDDFVFVDSEHTFEGMSRDWEAWSPRIAPGGMIAFHDAGREYKPWFSRTFPAWGWEHFFSPGDEGLFLARKLLSD